MKPELLAPAGNMASLKAAIEAGADAVYLAGKRYGARNYAGNFTSKELRKVINMAHLAGVRVYVTINTLLFDDEIRDAVEYAADLYSWGADAAIVQDIGFVKAVSDLVPLELHASTQMTITDLNGALYASDMGLKRIILAREVPLKDVRRISRSVETEVFVHGALCYSYSGQCLMSSFMGGRSGNRGRCAQPCRKEYTIDIPNISPDGPYLLSTRDLNTLEYLSEIIDAGVSSIKIEGRMRTPEYVALATHAYRHVLDTGEMPDSETLNMLTMAFNRRFTRGYIMGARYQNFMNHASQNNIGLKAGKVLSRRGQMLNVQLKDGITINKGDGVKVGYGGGLVYFSRKNKNDTWDIKVDSKARPGDELYITSSPLLSTTAKKVRRYGKRSITLDLTVHKDKPIELMARCGRHELTLKGDMVQEAGKRPITEESIRKAVGTLGNTAFNLEALHIDLEDNTFVPISALKALRRKLVDTLTLQIIKSYRHDRPELHLAWPQAPQSSKTEKPIIVVRVGSLKAAREAISSGADIALLTGVVNSRDGIPKGEMMTDSLDGHRSIIYELPRITQNNFFNNVGKDIKNTGLPLMAHSLGAKMYFGDQAIVDGFSMNITNSFSAAHLAESFEALEVSPEADLDQIRNIASVAKAWVQVHGPQEVMISEDCIPASLGACDRCRSGLYTIKDNAGNSFPVLRDGDCRTHIYNSRVTCMIEHLKEIIDTGVSGIILDLRFNEREDAGALIRLYLQGVHQAIEIGAVRKKIIKKVYAHAGGQNYTTGHFFDRPE